MNKPRTYWDTFNGAYQMGRMTHRMFLLNKFIELGDKRFLDVGCGTGPLYEIIKDDNLGLEYKGVDYSYAMIDVCRNLFPEGNFEVGDARDLQEEDNHWDAVVLMHSLDHLDDYQSAIKEACRVAKNHVFLILWRSLLEKGTHLNSINTMGRDDPWEDTHLQEYSREVLVDEFSKNGFKVLEEVADDRVNEPGRHNYLFIFGK